MSLNAGEQFPKGIKFGYIKFAPEIGEVTSCGVPTVYDCDKELPNKKVAIVSVPGAFTPTCTANHIPPFIKKAAEIKARGVDDIIVLASNDPFVQSAWGKALGDKGDLIFATDSEAAFSAAGGYESVGAVPKRTGRYALIVDHGKIVYSAKEPGKEVTVSGVDAVLEAL
ncbi:peroxiredoxin Ahp1p [Trichomonascus vanleenenianus]|uniref:peroxiredoxin family protein n=1 Tax=Trichomonascus vanleenenianus TaxID=2268995 RepID=UPI003EC9B741